MNFMMCQARRHDGTLCGRDAHNYIHEGKTIRHCHLHRQTRRKQIGDFVSELNTVFRNGTSECYDLCNIVFPENGWDSVPDIIDKPIYVRGALFYGDTEIKQKFEHKADFGNAVFYGRAKFSRDDERKQFKGNVIFHKTEFKEHTEISAGFEGFVNFREAHFFGRFDILAPYMERGVSFADARFDGRVKLHVDSRGKADFRSAIFKKDALFVPTSIFKDDVDFSEAEFHSAAAFSGVHFGAGQKPNGNVSFHRTRFKDQCDFTGTEFRIETDFNLAVFEVPARVFFVDTNLSQVRFEGCDISEVLFHRVKWSRSKKHWFHAGRNKVHDEVLMFSRKEKDVEADDRESVAQTYRRLQANYSQSYRYPEAGDFYVGEQEMVRQARGSIKEYICVNFLYKLISCYGESYRRPLGWLIVVLSLIPIIFLWSGVAVDQSQSLEYYSWRSSGYAGDVCYLRPELNRRDFTPFDGAYWDVVVVNLKLVSCHACIVV